MNIAGKLEKYRLQLQRHVQILTLRYDIKREYFTLGIPIFLALMILLAAVLTGHSFVTDDPGVDGAPINDEVAAKQAAYEALVAEMEAAEAAERGEVLPVDEEELEPEPDDESKDDLDHIMVFAILVALIPYSIDSYIQKKLLQKR